MGLPVLIIGKSGSGKSCSLREFTKNIYIINVLGKELPFKNAPRYATTDDYETVKKHLFQTKMATCIIDDCGYLMTNQFMKNHSTTGAGNAVFSLYNSIGDNFWSLIQFVKTSLPPNKIVYFMMHEDKNDAGDIKPKSIGKMLDDKVCIEGMFTIVLRCSDHKFFTQATDGDIAKTPMEMFKTVEIDNDLKVVDDVIREYYNLSSVITPPQKPTEETNRPQIKAE